MRLATAMSGLDHCDALLENMCLAAKSFLEHRLREEVLPEECGKAFPMAAAAIATRAYEEGISPGGLETLTAGDLTLQTHQEGNRLYSAAILMLQPWLKDGEFAFQGV